MTEKETGGAPVEELHFFLLGSLSPRVGESVVAAVSRQISIPCRLKGTLSLEDLPMIEGRRQADADALLHVLETRPLIPGTAVVGLTGVDIGTRIFRFVFGRARRGGDAAVVSMARLDPRFYGMPADPGLAIRRFATEVLHEVGHLAGLDHCNDFSCRMHFVANVESLDLRGNGLCGRCNAADGRMVSRR